MKKGIHPILNDLQVVCGSHGEHSFIVKSTRSTKLVMPQNMSDHKAWNKNKKSSLDNLGTINKKQKRCDISFDTI